MPKMDGFKFANCIRATEEMFGDQIAKASDVGRIKASLKSYIMAITANFDIENNVQLNKSIDHFIKKPATRDLIMDAFRNYLITNY